MVAVSRTRVCPTPPVEHLFVGRQTTIWWTGAMMATSKSIASKAGKVLRDPRASKVERTLAGSVLRNRRRRPKARKGR
jgi:hypothetical protein